MSQEITLQAIDELRSGNMELATKIRTLVHRTIEKANEMVDQVETPLELQTLIRTAEIAAKTVGLAPTESVTNVQINAISGFEFIEIDVEEETRQIKLQETFDAKIV